MRNYARFFTEIDAASARARAMDINADAIKYGYIDYLFLYPVFLRPATVILLGGWPRICFAFSLPSCRSIAKGTDMTHRAACALRRDRNFVGFIVGRINRYFLCHKISSQEQRKRERERELFFLRAHYECRCVPHIEIAKPTHPVYVIYKFTSYGVNLQFTRCQSDRRLQRAMQRARITNIEVNSPPIPR